MKWPLRRCASKWIWNFLPICNSWPLFQLIVSARIIMNTRLIVLGVVANPQWNCADPWATLPWLQVNETTRKIALPSPTMLQQCLAKDQIVTHFQWHYSAMDSAKGHNTMWQFGCQIENRVLATSIGNKYWFECYWWRWGHCGWVKNTNCDLQLLQFYLESVLADKAMEILFMKWDPTVFTVILLSHYGNISNLKQYYVHQKR